MSDYIDRIIDSVFDMDTDVQDTASSSGSEFIDWDKWDHDTRATTLPSEGEIADTKVLPAEGATAPANDPSHVEDTHTQEGPTHEPQSLLFPAVHGPDPPRPDTIPPELLFSQQPPRETAPEEPPQLCSPSGRRTRHVHDLEKTNMVRKLGACYHCRISKTACGYTDSCNACSRQFKEHPSCSQRACIRKPLEKLVPAKFERWNWTKLSLVVPGHSQSDNTIPIHCSLSESRPPLLLHATWFTNETCGWFSIKHSNLPSVREIAGWMERHILAENSASFEACMDKLLVGFARNPQPGPQPWAQRIPEQLVLDILTMRCMSKVWNAKSLVLQPDVGTISQFQDCLRRLAGQAISELERKIAKDLWRLFNKEKEKACHPTVHVVKWVLLWQMILIYRQSLERLQADAEPFYLGAAPLSAWRRDFQNETTQLLEAVIVMYNVVFPERTIKKVETAELPSSSAGNDVDLQRTHRNAWDAFPDFCRKVSCKTLPADDLLFACLSKQQKSLHAKAPAPA
ncbi:hypothetical protein VTH06DRAFT_4880 [Thermothelomyces fergusii]